MSLQDFTLIILAAGKGKRLGGDQPKPLILLGGTPLIEPLLIRTRELPFAKHLVAISEHTAKMKERYPWSELTFVATEPRGTGDAIEQLLPQVNTPYILVTQADDSFFLESATIEKLAVLQTTSDCPAFLASAHMNRQANYSPIKHRNGRLLSIHRNERLDARPPKDVVTGLYSFKTAWVSEKLKQVPFGSNGEKSLPSVFDLALSSNEPVGVMLYSEDEWYGINTPEELAAAEVHLKA